MKYNLNHLTQNEKQNVVGPIQDDEALFLYSLIRCKRIKTILEIGGLEGYSSLNFIEAMKFDNSPSYLFTCDRNKVPTLDSNHINIQKDVSLLNSDDLDKKHIELVFLDCHSMAQIDMLERLQSEKCINEDTIITLHDTNLHYQKIWDPNGQDDFVHQRAERSIVDYLKKKGWDILKLHTKKDKHSEEFPFRHGLTICQWNPLAFNELGI